MLAEEIARCRIDEFYYGDRVFSRPEDPRLRALADQHEMIESPEHAYDGRISRNGGEPLRMCRSD